MAGIADIFTGGSTEGTPGQVIDTTPDAYAGLRGPLASQLRAIFTGAPGGFSLGGIPASPDARAAPITPQEQQFVNQIGAQPGQRAGTTNASFDLTNRTIQGEFLDPASNPMLAAHIAAAQRPVIEQFNRQTVPNLQQQFTAAGQLVQPQGSSPFDRALAQSQSDYLNTLADISTNISANNYQQERTRQQEAVEQGAGLQRAELDNLVTSLQASALPRLVEQLGLDKGLEEFRRRTDVLLQVLGLSGNLSSGNTAVIPGTAPPAQEGFGSLLTGAGALLQGYGALSA